MANRHVGGEYELHVHNATVEQVKETQPRQRPLWVWQVKPDSVAAAVRGTFLETEHDHADDPDVPEQKRRDGQCGETAGLRLAHWSVVPNSLYCAEFRCGSTGCDVRFRLEVHGGKRALFDTTFPPVGARRTVHHVVRFAVPETIVAVDLVWHLNVDTPTTPEEQVARMWIGTTPRLRLVQSHLTSYRLNAPTHVYVLVDPDAPHKWWRTDQRFREAGLVPRPWPYASSPASTTWWCDTLLELLRYHTETFGDQSGCVLFTETDIQPVGPILSPLITGPPHTGVGALTADYANVSLSARRIPEMMTRLRLARQQPETKTFASVVQRWKVEVSDVFVDVGSTNYFLSPVPAWSAVPRVESIALFVLVDEPRDIPSPAQQELLLRSLEEQTFPFWDLIYVYASADLMLYALRDVAVTSGDSPSASASTRSLTSTSGEQRICHHTVEGRSPNMFILAATLPEQLLPERGRIRFRMFLAPDERLLDPQCLAKQLGVLVCPCVCAQPPAPPLASFVHATAASPCDDGTQARLDYAGSPPVHALLPAWEPRMLRFPSRSQPPPQQAPSTPEWRFHLMFDVSCCSWIQPDAKPTTRVEQATVFANTLLARNGVGPLPTETNGRVGLIHCFSPSFGPYYTRYLAPPPREDEDHKR